MEKLELVKEVKPEYQEEVIKALEKAKKFYDKLSAEKQLKVQEIMDGVTGIKVHKKLCITSLEYLFAKVNFLYDPEDIFPEDIDDDEYMATEEKWYDYIYKDSKDYETKGIHLS